MTDDKATIAMLHEALKEKHANWCAENGMYLAHGPCNCGTDAALAATEAESAAFVERVRAEQADTDEAAFLSLLRGEEALPVPRVYADALAKHDAEVRAAALECVREVAAAAWSLGAACGIDAEEKAAILTGQHATLEGIIARALAQVHPPGQVAEKATVGASGLSSDALAAAPEGAAPVCATCGGAHWVSVVALGRPDAKKPCPDCARGGR